MLNYHQISKTIEGQSITSRKKHDDKIYVLKGQLFILNNNSNRRIYIIPTPNTAVSN